jgi:dihydroorotate dehydrogenase electron transfer subunit
VSDPGATASAELAPRRTLGICAVRGNRTVAHDTVILTIDVDLQQMPRAGQFAMVHPLRAGCLLGRPFSILDYKPPAPGRLGRPGGPRAMAGTGELSERAGPGAMEILVKAVGRGSRALAKLSAGDRVRVFAPLGRPFDDPQLRAGPLVMVAGGVGIVPLHLLARELAAERLASASTPAPLGLFGARTPSDIPTELFDRRSDNWRLWVEREPDRAAGMRQGMVTDGLREALEQQPDAVVATCGPTPMMREVARTCRQSNVPLWLCLEAQMGCGAGVCRACVVPDACESRMRTVCKEGPVFRLEEIAYG